MLVDIDTACKPEKSCAGSRTVLLLGAEAPVMTPNAVHFSLLVVTFFSLFQEFVDIG